MIQWPHVVLHFHSSPFPKSGNKMNSPKEIQNHVANKEAAAYLPRTKAQQDKAMTSKNTKYLRMQT